MKKLTKKQQTKYRFRHLFYSIKNYLSISVLAAVATILFSVPTVLMIPLAIAASPIIIIVGSIYGFVKSIVSFFTRKPTYKMAKEEIDSKFEQLISKDKYILFVTSVVNEYKRKKTLASSRDSEHLIAKFDLMLKNIDFLSEEIDGGETNIINECVSQTTSWVNEYLITEKDNNIGSRLFNILQDKLSAVEYIQNSDHAEVRKNARILHQVLRAYGVHSLFRPLASNICQNGSLEAGEIDQIVNLNYMRPSVQPVMIAI